MRVYLELIGLFAVLAAVFAASRSGLAARFSWQKRLAAFTNHRGLTVLAVGVLALAGQAAMELVRHPLPAIHDEFAYLLAGDTFAAGRLTNPTHPMWKHFESFYVLHVPSYQMKYPPAQGVFLALGQVLTGQPIVGVWISYALAVAALCWMLQAWVRPRWAPLGALLCILNPDMFTRWGQSYWGGAVAMLGGCLLFGALPRIMRDCRLRDAVVLAIGVTLLANSRMYVGLLVSLATSLVLLVWLVRYSPGWRITTPRLILPVILVLSATGSWMAYYNYRVTGNPLKLPYTTWLEVKGLSTAQVLFGISRTSVEPRREFSAGLGRVRGLTDVPQRPVTTKAGQPRLLCRRPLKLIFFWLFLCGALLTLPLLLSMATWRSRRTQFAGCVSLLVLAALTQTTEPALPHYIAPIVGLFYVLVVQGLRVMASGARRGRPAERLFVPAISTACLVVFLACLARYAMDPVPRLFFQFGLERARISQSLRDSGGKHLVLVHYSPQHDFHQEWVYNAADIDRAVVVWARDLGDQDNRKLLDYFHDRLVWRLDADAEPVRIAPMPEPTVHDTVPGTNSW